MTQVQSASIASAATPARAALAAPSAASPPSAQVYLMPVPRGAARVLPQQDPAGEPAAWALWALDRLDQGVLLLQADGRVDHANPSAREQIGAAGLLALAGGRLHAASAADQAALQGALRTVAERGICRLLQLGTAQASLYLALSAIGRPGGLGPVLGLLGRRNIGNHLTMQWYAQCHALTIAETQVLGCLCAGFEPGEVASINGVALSTVRTQIAAIRQKTGAATIRALVQAVARLPPMRPVLSNDAVTRH
jgi:DNA-binding CsgD family transcriptional regulator